MIHKEKVNKFSPWSHLLVGKSSINSQTTFSTKAGLLVWFGLILLLRSPTSFKVKETALLIHQSSCSPSVDYVCMCMLTTKKCFNQSISPYWSNRDH